MLHYKKSSSISKNQPNSYTSPVSTPFTKQMDYQQKAKLLFDKLNNVREVIEDTKYSRHQKLVDQITILQQMLNNNSAQKGKAFQKILQSLSSIQSQIEEQKIQAERNLLKLQTKINNTNRQCDRLFDKMTRERLDSQSHLLKAIDDRMEILFQRNKSLNSSPLYDQSMIQLNPFIQQINHLKDQVQSFYQKIRNEQQKIMGEFNNSINQFRSFLNSQLQQIQSQNSPIMNCMKDLHIEVNDKIDKLKRKRQQIEQNVITMLQRIVQSFQKEKKC